MNARGIAVLLMVLFTFAAAVASAFPPRARVYPLWVAIVGAALAVVTWLRAPPSETVTGPALSEVVRYLAWIGGLLVITAIVGLPAASALFAAAFLKYEGKVGIGASVGAAIATGLGLLALGAVLDLRWPAALIDVARLLGLS